jgi:GWxTD domain-containing protein
MRGARSLWFCSIFGLAAFVWTGWAADKAKPVPAKRDTVARPMTERDKRKQEDRLRKELEAPYRRWLDEDVGYIITSEERTAFKRLATAEEQENFIEQFWLRRDPTPDSVENEFREEHYRRIAYANERYASGIPGWKTDRGRIYITYGPPDENESHPSGGSYNRPMDEGGGTTTTYPFEIWRYRYIEGVGTDVLIEFVDKSMTGEYRMTLDPSEKDALLYVPNAGLTMMEEMGLSDKADRFSRTDGTRMGVSQDQLSARLQPFERLHQFANLQKPPAIKFKDLEAAVSSKISYNVLPMRVRVDYVRMTNSSILTNITVLFERRDLQFQNKEGIEKATVNLYGRITNMSRRPINVFEDPITVEVPAELLEEAARGSSIYGKSIPLAPGLYRLNIVAKDVVGGNMNNYEVALNVPRFDDETLASSTMVLADVLEPVPTRNIGTGQFVVGTMKVRPRVGETFRANEKMGVYVQFYNFAADDKTQKPNGVIQYEVTKDGTSEKVIDFTEDLTALDGASAAQVTVEKLLPLSSLGAGKYNLKVTAIDRGREKQVSTSSAFTVF